MRKIVLFITVIAIGLFLVSCGGSATTTPTTPAATTPVATTTPPVATTTPPVTTSAAPSVDAQALYTKDCSACHGPSRAGVGSTFPPLTPTSLAGDSIADITNIITNGSPTNPVMAAWKDKLTAGEITALANFLKNVAP